MPHLSPVIWYIILGIAMLSSSAKDLMDSLIDGSTSGWSKWGAWSPCSRSCGGGVSLQKRNCNRISSATTEVKVAEVCPGEATRYYECNTHACPGAQDSRSAQCSEFNTRPFRGRYYTWIPYIDGSSPCTLNCRPEGYSFYASLATVADGTSCTIPGSRAICVHGTCRVVGKEVLSSADRREVRCGRRLVSGLFSRPRLPLGYSHVATVPRGACRLNVSEIMPSDNYIALKITNGSYITNGEFAISSPGTYDAAGARFHYKRITGLDTVFATGPLQQPIDIMILYTQTNANIKYEYLTEAKDDLDSEHDPEVFPDLPNRHIRRHDLRSQAKEIFLSDSHTKSEVDEKKGIDDEGNFEENSVNTRTFVWKIVSYTQCSRSCGGGFQVGKFKCMETSVSSIEKEVSPVHCPGSPPATKRRRCGLGPCQPRWRSTAWSACPQCGPATRTRNVGCVQDHAKGIIKISDKKCSNPKPESIEVCDIPNCVTKDPLLKESDQNVDHFKDGPVYTVSVENYGAELGPEYSLNSPGGWLYSEWSECVGWCVGGGIQTRGVKCADPAGCLSTSSPNTTRACSAQSSCEPFEGQWFTGEWSACSSSCKGKQVRGVLCIGGTGRHLKDAACKEPRPDGERSCGGQCEPSWYMGDWSQCSGDCSQGKGVQRRTVLCSQTDNDAAKKDCPSPKPVSQRACKLVDCTTEQSSIFNDQSAERREDDNVVSSDARVNRKEISTVGSAKNNRKVCADKLTTCSLAVQARLCHYNYYMDNCCQSCSESLDL